MAPPSNSANSASSQVPYIGSTISLLSKAGIRYEGFLHSIDQKEASVTLDHVRVFGTEERQCERRVPPSTETFEYIIFRAADITELRVIDTPLSRPVPDPAIIRVQVKGPGNAGANSSTGGGGGGGISSGGGEAARGRTGASGGGGRRRQARGNSSGRGAGGRPGRGQSQQQQQPQHQQRQQQLPASSQYPQLAPPPPVMQLPVTSPQQHQQQQQSSRNRNDYIMYPRYNVSYRGNGGGGFYPMYRPSAIYPTAAGGHGYPMLPPNVGGGGGGPGGGRPVMHFRRFHGGGGGGGSRRLSPRLIGLGAGNGGSGGGRGRYSRRSHQSNGIAEASANPGNYFSADYDFETANAEMAKLLLEAVKSSSSSSTKPAVVNGGVASEEEENSASSNAAAAAVGGAETIRCSSGYDRERSFFDDISRVDADAGGGAAAGGGDSARIGRKEAARQNALNRETFGLTGRRFHGNHQHHRGPATV